MITIYHNPRCSKSREGLCLLEEKGISFETVKYLDQPLEDLPTGVTPAIVPFQ